MIKNLVINGCSFTQDGQLGKLWPQVLQEQLKPQTYHNLARGGAGNFYIANSTIEFLEKQDFNPQETMVIVMWSGTGRKDLRINGAWYYQLADSYNWGVKSHQDEDYYLFSGGISNSWCNNPITKKIFSWLYKTSDPYTLCKDSLMHFKNLENYLKVNQYQYQFTSFVNYWQPDQESCPLGGDYSIAYWLKDEPIYQKFCFDNWFFADADKNSLGEFAKQRGLLDATHHPTHLAHEQYAQEVVLPRIRM